MTSFFFLLNDILIHWEFCKYKTSMGQKQIIDLFCSLRCPVNSFTDVPFIMVLHGENVFWTWEGISLYNCKWPLGKNINCTLSRFLKIYVFYSVYHVALPWLHLGSQWTNQTLALRRSGATQTWYIWSYLWCPPQAKLHSSVEFWDVVSKSHTFLSLCFIPPIFYVH